MKFRTNMIAALSTIAMIAATPALADKKHDDHGEKRPVHSQGHKDKDDNGRHLALGHDKAKHRDADHDRDRDHKRGRDRDGAHRMRVGDRFSDSGFERVRDPGSLGLERNRGWDYYRKGSDVYRVDSNTQRILAITNMLNIFGG
ncbi:hypothetical protein [Paracoccus sp. R86501]|uniref:hypothetical protein n=1 Tax=Paracoccus sp. R86501 TaxID=3101711 RepID=UPI003671815B